MTEANEFKLSAQGRKAYLLARSLWNHGMRDPRQVDRVGSDLWHAVAYDAGTNPPSSRECKAVIRGVLAGMVEEAADSGRTFGAASQQAESEAMA